MKKLLKLRDEMKEDLLHADGSVEDGTKMTYGQGFLLYAFSEYVRATGSEEARRYADMTYDYIENECKEGNYYLENARGTGSSNGAITEATAPTSASSAPRKTHSLPR